MKSLLKYLFLFTPMIANSQSFDFKILKEKFEKLTFGEIKPEGWIKNQMKIDLQGFVGNLDILVPELINDPIYSERLHKYSNPKELGNLKAGDAEGDEQYKWWNSETQSNWWDGYIRNAFLLDDKNSIAKSKKHVEKILASQDSDGYIGIYDLELRYKFTSENGELWSKTTLLRGLLAYYEATNDTNVWKAIVKAVNNVMENYPIDNSSPFFAGKAFSGGVAHGLTFTDICDKMYQLTKDEKYRQYALFLYKNFCQNISSEKDIQVANILDPSYRLFCHGVHTYEHLRPLIIAVYSSNDSVLQNALKIYLERIEKITTVSGAPIGDEWIAGRNADETETGYEYCSIHELTDSYCMLLQKEGINSIADKIENLFYNAAQGARNPNHSCIAYLKTDNSYEMQGTKNGIAEPNRKQTRYKYSPAHQDVAVCCNPNAGRITPYFVQNMWMKEDKNTLIATLLGPCRVETKLLNNNIIILEKTEYPYQNDFSFKIILENPTAFKLKIRKPKWVKSIACNTNYHTENEYIAIERTFNNSEEITLKFDAKVEIQESINKEYCFRFGALLYAYPIYAKETKDRVYSSNLNDYFYIPIEKKEFTLIGSSMPIYENGKIQVIAINNASRQNEKIDLVPIGKTILRQVTFRK